MLRSYVLEGGEGGDVDPEVEGLSDFYREEFADELTHIMSLQNLECFKIKVDPDPGNLTSIDLEIRKNVSTTNVNVPLEDDQSYLFAYVVWIFLAFLTYLVWNFHEIQCLSKPLEGKSDDDFIFHLLPHGPMNSGSSRACDSVNKNEALEGKSDDDFIFHLLPHGPMNSGSSRACDSVNKNEALRGRHPMLS
ncbi:hypothetical protein Tco_1102741 [Tanacetum coccineum]